jgi:large subunit ribosomal protein L23
MLTKQSYKIIRYPSVTEKNTLLRSANKYVFEVEPGANKTQIKQAIETLFKVNVVSVNTLVVKGKYKRQGRFAGYKSNWKKAFVRIKEGQKIEKFGEV